MWSYLGCCCCSTCLDADESVGRNYAIRSRLTEVPISAYIPYYLLFGIFLFSSLLCIVASILSVHFIVNQPIAFTAKGGRR